MPTFNENLVVNGMVGVGTSSPRTPLDVIGRIATGLDHNSAGTITFFPPDGYAWFHIDNGPARRPTGRLRISGGVNPGDNEFMSILQNGKVGIGTINPAYNLDVAGEAHASDFLVSSDARLKTNIRQLTRVLEKLEKLRAVSFEWNGLCESLGRSTGHQGIGMIAQEIETVFPELVTTQGEHGYRAVGYGGLTGVLVEGVKELRAEKDRQIQALATETATCQQQVDCLQQHCIAHQQEIEALKLENVARQQGHDALEARLAILEHRLGAGTGSQRLITEASNVADFG